MSTHLLMSQACSEVYISRQVVGKKTILSHRVFFKVPLDRLFHSKILVIVKLDIYIVWLSVLTTNDIGSCDMP